jgi:hypothetical protein
MPAKVGSHLEADAHCWSQQPSVRVSSMPRSTLVAACRSGKPVSLEQHHPGHSARNGMCRLSLGGRPWNSTIPVQPIRRHFCWRFQRTVAPPDTRSISARSTRMVRLHLGQWLITSQPFARIWATVSAVRRQSSALQRSRFLLPTTQALFRKCSALSSRAAVAAVESWSWTNAPSPLPQGCAAIALQDGSTFQIPARRCGH